jgi:hypothetical protein
MPSTSPLHSFFASSNWFRVIVSFLPLHLQMQVAHLTNRPLYKKTHTIQIFSCPSHLLRRRLKTPRDRPAQLPPSRPRRVSMPAVVAAAAAAAASGGARLLCLLLNCRPQAPPPDADRWEEQAPLLSAQGGAGATIPGRTGRL